MADPLLITAFVAGPLLTCLAVVRVNERAKRKGREAMPRGAIVAFTVFWPLTLLILAAALAWGVWVARRALVEMVALTLFGWAVALDAEAILEAGRAMERMYQERLKELERKPWG